MSPRLPRARGPLSDAVIRLLLGEPASAGRIALGLLPLATAPVERALDAEDEVLALYLVNEAMWRGFSGCPTSGDDHPALLTCRATLEDRLERAVRTLVPPLQHLDPSATVAAVRQAIEDFDGPSLSSYVAEQADLLQLRELAIHRSAYQLKEADQHTAAMAMLPAGPAKSAMVEIQFDEYGSGVPGQAHAELFAVTMEALGADSAEGAHLDEIPSTTLTTVNLLSLFVRQRRHLGAALGHLAIFEMTSVTPMGRYAAGVRRALGAVDAESAEHAARFYDVHVVADAHHEQLAQQMLVDHLLMRPEDSVEVQLGAHALMEVERRFAGHILRSWQAGATSLHRPRRADVSYAAAG